MLLHAQMLSYNASTSGMPVPVMTMADFNNERYGKAFAGVKVTTPPKKFPIVDRCICGDTDWFDWSSCISALNSLGLNGVSHLLLPPCHQAACHALFALPPSLACW